MPPFARTAKRSMCFFVASFFGLGTFASARAAAPVIYKKVLFVGDSITYHQAAPALDWTGTWGMAATAEDKDYVHVFLRKLSENQKLAPEHLVMAKGGGTLAGQLTTSQQMTDYHADLAIVQMGENDRATDDAGFGKPYAQVLTAIRAGNPGVKILCTGVWGPPNGDLAKDAVIRQVCKANKATFVDIVAIEKDLQAQAKSTGLYSSAGVQWHPSDYGMAKYADALWNTLNDSTGTQSGEVTAAAKTESKSVLKEKWESNSAVAWIPARPPIEKKDGVPAAKMTTAKTGDSDMVQITLVPAEIAGKWLTIQTRVKGSGISNRPNPYNGPKVILHLHNAEGADDYPQVDSLPDGSFDWKEVNWRLRVSDNTVSAELGIGLENVQGTLWVAPISITAQD